MRRWLSAPALVALLAGCAGSPLGSSGPSYFRASIDNGAITYEGTATFHTGSPGPGRTLFQISSFAAAEGQSFALTRWDGGRLRAGSYAISLVDFGDAGRPVEPRGMSFQYFNRSDGIEQQYVAESGTLVITRSSRSRVTGTFTIAAIRYCLMDVTGAQEPEGTCNALPATAPDDAHRITVTGSFVATPFVAGAVEFR